MRSLDSGGSVLSTSFIVHLWLEKRTRAAQPIWRFQVLHVQSGERQHCTDISAVLAFVEDRAGLRLPMGKREPKHHLKDLQV